jgi:hypothetical protein
MSEPTEAGKEFIARIVHQCIPYGQKTHAASHV